MLEVQTGIKVQELHSQVSEQLTNTDKKLTHIKDNYMPSVSDKQFKVVDERSLESVEHINRIMTTLIPGFQEESKIVLAHKVDRSEMEDMLEDK